jgi:DNA-binding NtrC family response regulator
MTAPPGPPGPPRDPDGPARAGHTEGLSADEAVARGHALVPRFTLRVEAGPDQGRAAVSRDERLVVGAEAGADLQLGDSAVSRFHCELVVVASDAPGAPPRIHVRDLGSRNGTTVDGVAVVDAILHPGAVLGIGRDRLRFEPADEPARVPLSSAARFGSLAGGSPVMRAVYALLERAATSDATVLLTGETGTGKEAAAESLHAASPRRDGPFVVLDCGSIPPTLLESELFGHARGAFTGATAERTGAFEAASGGTIFLDEIGELPAELQPKLLRALERREVKRLGESHYTAVDVRVVAATHRDLRAEINARAFRADLYYRLAVIEIRLPPLRERAGDLPAIAERLLEGAPPARRAELTAPTFLAHLAAHRWPGNVRELRNYLDRCVALGVELAPPPAAAPGEGPPGGGDPLAGGAARPLREAREEATRRFERAYLDDLLQRHGDNLAGAARAAGIDRAHLYRLLWKHGLK